MELERVDDKAGFTAVGPNDQLHEYEVTGMYQG